MESSERESSESFSENRGCGQLQWQLPDYYGKNLDALYDCLTEQCEPLTLIVPAAVNEPLYLHGYGVQLVATLRDAASENENLKIVIEK